MTDKELFDAFLEVASHSALRAAAAATRSGRSIAEAVCWPCCDRVVAPAVHPWPDASAFGAAAAAAGAVAAAAQAPAAPAGFPFQIFPTMLLVILSIQSSSWASTALIEKILDRARLVPVGPRRVQRALRSCFF